ncbi:MAG TPA: BON domain-containing protein [Gammaproteobacteria bacterium]
MKNSVFLRSFRFLAVVAFSGLLAACAGSETQTSTGEYIDDSVITARVKTSLMNSPEVKGLSVDVETFKGEVQLSGFVDTEEEQEEAGRLAKAVEGVRSVKNDIVVK